VHLTVTPFFTDPTCSGLAAFPLLKQCDPSAVATSSPICSAPAGIAIGPPLPGYPTSINGPLPGGTGGQIMLGCNGQASNADPNRMELIIADGTACPAPPIVPPCPLGGAASGTILATIPFESGSDEIDYDPIKNTYILPRGVNNSWNNNGVSVGGFGAPACPSIAGYTLPYGGTTVANGIYTSTSLPLGVYTANTTGTTPNINMAGPQVLGFVDAHTGTVGQADIVTGFFNCPDTVSPFVANPHGTNGHIAVDPVHQQIYVPINATSDIIVTDPITGKVTTTLGICSTNGAIDARGCIAVYQKVAP
jgi:hypothetical protein